MKGKSQGPNEISVPTWVKRGQMLVSRAALDWDDPDSDYSYIKNTLKLNPEDYGVMKPEERCHECGQVIKPLGSEQKEEK